MREHIAAGRALALAALGVIALAFAPMLLPPFYLRVGETMLYSAGLGVAWGILGGFAGYASFGTSAFVGVGAFAAGLVETEITGLAPAWLLVIGILIGAAACALLSALVAYPILRLRGTFFAIAMLGVSHVCAELNNNVDALQGSLGINLPPVTPQSMDPVSFFFELYLAAAALILLIAWLIHRSKFGAGLLSIREDEDIARMLGVPTERYKRAAFVISAVLTGVLGVIFAHDLGYITTGSVYRDDTNLNVVVFSLLGGMGTLFGPVIGAVLLVFIVQVLLGSLLDFHLFATGLLLVALILAAPGGVVGLRDRFARRHRAAAGAPAE